MLLSVVRAGWRHPDRGTPIPVLPTRSSHLRPRGTPRLHPAAELRAGSLKRFARRMQCPDGSAGISLTPDVAALLLRRTTREAGFSAAQVTLGPGHFRQRGAHHGVSP